jgi:hypothetical protein
LNQRSYGSPEAAHVRKAAAGSSASMRPNAAAAERREPRCRLEYALPGRADNFAARTVPNLARPGVCQA